MNIEQRILKEFIYERVRASVNLCQLVIFEQHLDTSIERAVSDTSLSPEEQTRLTRQYLDDAWKRLEEEWHEMRDRFDEFAE